MGVLVYGLFAWENEDIQNGLSSYHQEVVLQ